MSNSFIETFHAAKSRFKGYVHERMVSIGDQPFCFMQSVCDGNLIGRCTDMALKQPVKMSRTQTQTVRQLSHCVLIEEPTLNDPESPANDSCRA